MKKFNLRLRDYYLVMPGLGLLPGNRLTFQECFPHLKELKKQSQTFVCVPLYDHC